MADCAFVYCLLGTQRGSSLQSLFAQLEKFPLTLGELQMIANLRPNSVLQLLCILLDCERRFTDEEMAVSCSASFLVVCLFRWQGVAANY